MSTAVNAADPLSPAKALFASRLLGRKPTSFSITAFVSEIAGKAV